MLGVLSAPCLSSNDMAKPSHIFSFVAAGVLLLVAVATAPFFLITLLVAINAVNPLQTVTILSVRVANRSGQDLLITPVGTMGRGRLGPDKMGTKHVLSQFLRKWPAIPKMVHKELPLGDGAERVITYDAEKVVFTDVVLCTHAGKRAQVQVSRYEGNRWVTSSTNDVFILEASSLSSPVDPQTAEAVRREARLDWFAVAALVPPPLCLISLGAAVYLILRVRNETSGTI
jgi:hypothetical protein